jgi:hypothetical protein
MTDVTVAGSREALDYFEEIIREMLFLFPITRSDAAGRLNRFWAGQDFTGELAVNLLKHELPTYWAKTIYYGRDKSWWKGENGLEPDSYP